MELKRIAQRMRRFASLNPRRAGEKFDAARYRAELSGGLRIVLYIDEQKTWHLAAYRLGGFPGRVEMETIRREFEILDPEAMALERLPQGAHATEVQQAVEALDLPRVHETREREPRGAEPEKQWHIVRLAWAEVVEQRPLMEMGPGGAVEYF